MKLRTLIKSKLIQAQEYACNAVEGFFYCIAEHDEQMLQELDENGAWHYVRTAVVLIIAVSAIISAWVFL